MLNYTQAVRDLTTLRMGKEKKKKPRVEETKWLQRR